jgi:hypothetical protein
MNRIVYWIIKKGCLKMTRKSQIVSVMTFLIMYVFFTLAGYAHAIRDIPDNNLAYPVLFVSNLGTETKTASGFYLNTEKSIYFVTARHVLFENAFVKIKDESIGKLEIPGQLRHRITYDKRNKLLIYGGVMSQEEKDALIKDAGNNSQYINAIKKLYKDSQKLRLVSTIATLLSYSKKGNDKTEIELQLKKLFDEGQIKYHPSQDVAVVKIGSLGNPVGDMRRARPINGVKKLSGSEEIWGLDKKNIKLFDDVLISNEIFSFGYPSSLSQYPPLNIKMPLLRKGITAGKNEVNKIIIIDCPSYYGNSGGLVIEKEQTQLFETKFNAIGVVSSLVPFIKGSPENFENSGYSIAVPMDPVLELIEE